MPPGTAPGTAPAAICCSRAITDGCCRSFSSSKACSCSVSLSPAVSPHKPQQLQHEAARGYPFSLVLCIHCSTDMCIPGVPTGHEGNDSKQKHAKSHHAGVFPWWLQTTRFLQSWRWSEAARFRTQRKERCILTSYLRGRMHGRRVQRRALGHLVASSSLQPHALPQAGATSPPHPPVSMKPNL